MNDQPDAPSAAAGSQPLPQSFHAPVAPSASLAGGILAGLLAAVVGAAVWAAVTCTTKYQIGWMAVGVGFLVGFAVRKFGRGGTPLYGGIGAVLALVGCLLGNYLTIIGFFSLETGTGLFEVLGQLPFPTAVELMRETFSPIDVLFYAIAVYEGYKFGSQAPA
jgi:hypothetical protein